MIAGYTFVPAKPAAAHTAAITRPTNTQPNTITAQNTPSLFPPSQAKHGRGATVTKYSSNIELYLAWLALICGAEEGATVTKYSSNIELYLAWLALICVAEEGVMMMKCS